MNEANGSTAVDSSPIEKSHRDVVSESMSHIWIVMSLTCMRQTAPRLLTRHLLKCRTVTWSVWSCHIYRWVMSLTWMRQMAPRLLTRRMSRVTYTDESCHMCECVMWGLNAPRARQLLTRSLLKSRTVIRCVSQYHMYKSVMSHIWMSQRALRLLTRRLSKRRTVTQCVSHVTYTHHVTRTNTSWEVWMFSEPWEHHVRYLQNFVSFIGLFCKRDNNFKGPTNHSHPIPHIQSMNISREWMWSIHALIWDVRALRVRYECSHERCKCEVRIALIWGEVWMPSHELWMLS